MMGDDAGLAGRHYERMVPCPSGPALDPPCSGWDGAWVRRPRCWLPN